MRTTIKKFGEILVGLAVVGAALLVYFLGGENNKAADKRVRQTPVVEVDTLKVARLDTEVEALGTGISKESVDISAGASEKIIKLNFQDGQWVKAGTVLAELEKNEEMAELNQADVNLQEEKREYERYKRLYESQTVASKEFDSKVTAYERAKTLRAVVLAKISDRTIVAPFDGILGNRMVSIGDLVTPGTLITTLDDISELKVDFHVPEKYFSKLKRGLEFTVANTAYPGRKFIGKISAVATRLNSITRSVEVRGIIPNPQEEGRWLLRPGMLLVVNLNLGSYNAVTIPEKSIMSLGEVQYIFIYDAAKQTVARREVRLGNRKDGMVEIVSGAKAGECFILEGVSKLNDGAKVEIARANQSAAPSGAPVIGK